MIDGARSQNFTPDRTPAATFARGLLIHKQGLDSTQPNLQGVAIALWQLSMIVEQSS